MQRTRVWENIKEALDGYYKSRELLKDDSERRNARAQEAGPVPQPDRLDEGRKLVLGPCEANGHRRRAVPGRKIRLAYETVDGGGAVEVAESGMT
jgi:hypothetical protein